MGSEIISELAKELVDGILEGFTTLQRIEICVREGDDSQAAAALVRAGKDRAYIGKGGVSVIVNPI